MTNNRKCEHAKDYFCTKCSIGDIANKIATFYAIPPQVEKPFINAFIPLADRDIKKINLDIKDSEWEDTQPTGEWVVDFKKLYNTGAPHQKMINLISNTLQSTLKKQRDEFVKNVDGLKKEIPKYTSSGENINLQELKMRSAYNWAIGDVLEVLKDNNK